MMEIGKMINITEKVNRKSYYTNGQLQYDGDWENDKYHGKGKLYTDGQLKYDGDFQNDNIHGEGKFYFENGNLIHDGDWENNTPQ